jgi:hypothetical protein
MTTTPRRQGTIGWHYNCFNVDIQITDRQNIDKMTENAYFI